MSTFGKTTMRKLFNPYTLLYISTIVFINMAFSYLPLIPTPIGMVEPGSILAGTVFVTRDFMQRSVGHFALVPMAIATVLSYMIADPFVATASALAFFTSEIVDWMLYTLTKKPFHQRVLISSIFSTPVDTFVFLYYIGNESADSFLMMCASKMVATLIIYFWGRHKAKKNGSVNNTSNLRSHEL